MFLVQIEQGGGSGRKQKWHLGSCDTTIAPPTFVYILAFRRRFIPILINVRCRHACESTLSAINHHDKKEILQAAQHDVVVFRLSRCGFLFRLSLRENGAFSIPGYITILHVEKNVKTRFGNNKYKLLHLHFACPSAVSYKFPGYLATPTPGKALFNNCGPSIFADWSRHRPQVNK